MRFGQRAATGVLLVLIVGCSDTTGLLAPLEPESELTIQAQIAAQTVVVGETITLSLNQDDATMARATKLQILVLDANGALSAQLDLDWSPSRDRNGVDLVLPVLPAGPYTLVVTAMADQDQLAQLEQSLFVVTTPPAITRLFVEPAALGRGLPARAVAAVRWESGQRPYLRWTFGDRVLAQGYADASEVAVTVPPPQSLGAFPITLDLFPWGPDEGLDATIQAAVSQTITVVVDDPEDIDSGDGSSARYATTYRLAADLLPTESSGNAPELQTSGDPTALAILGVVGYALSPDSGITIPSRALPEQGPLELAAQVAVGPQFVGTLAGVAAVDGSWSVELTADTATDYALMLTVDRDVIQTPLPVDLLGDDRLASIVLRLYEFDEGIGVVLAVDAKIVAELEQVTPMTIDVPRFGYFVAPVLPDSAAGEAVTDPSAAPAPSELTVAANADQSAALPETAMFVNEVALRSGAVWHGAAGRLLADVVVAQTGHFPDLIASERSTLTSGARLWFAVDDAADRVVVEQIGPAEVAVRTDSAASPNAVYEITYQRERGVRALLFDETELMLQPDSDLVVQTDLAFALVADDTN